ncbi:MAG: alpha/beta hydrolase [Bacteroidota bacterium]
MKCKIALWLILIAQLGHTQTELYTKTFGQKNHPAIIYLHGGPGYNSTSFEATTAQKLADQGIFVIVYDRRGEGRSDKVEAVYTFEETIADIAQLYKQFELENATLIGHSFGGIVGTLFAEKHPERIDQLVLLAAPISLQVTFQTIIDSVEVIYKSKADSINLQYVTMLRNMDRNTLEFSSYCFMHAMANGFYTPKNLTQEAQLLYKSYQQSELGKYGQQMSYEAPQGFWENEQYTSLDLTLKLKNLVQKGISIYGIYGQEDGLYATEQIRKIGQIIGEEQLFYWENCAHNPYIDQQEKFLKAMVTFEK